ncbi:bifunctional phosphatase PAP2/diacylglycerol kinase family protein [Nocardia sp. CA-145437]|uniref:bifunctional phosphatase PAP2/diacylglycerol kinase family protein n=1 Tax=Nocardia sp. CA-145437 TaxID=3239980 RepID=UPI003D9865DE
MTGLARRFQRVGSVDRALTAAVARLPASPLDSGLLRLTRTADFGALWLVIALALGTRGGEHRRAAIRGVAALTATEAIVNGGLKPIIARRRPAADLLPPRRRSVPRPASSSFPSGHSAAAAAFATAVAVESPRAAAGLIPLAGLVAYSRVHTGVHWGSDALAGALIGSAVALATRHWWPAPVQAIARERHQGTPALPAGDGLLVLVNPVAGDPAVDPCEELATLLPAATLVRIDQGDDPARRLELAFRACTPRPTALGVAGGDGTLAAAATVALRRGLPLAVFPTGTRNHFARDLGVRDTAEAAAAVESGDAVDIDIARVRFDDEDGQRTRHVLNVASVGAYPEMVRLRRKWRSQWGRRLAFAAASVAAVRRARPLTVEVDGDRRRVWVLFFGNGSYHPRRSTPAVRDHLAAGLLDIRWLRADRPWSRVRIVLAAGLAAVGRTRLYGECRRPELTVRLASREPLAADGEVIGTATRIHMTVARRLTVYRLIPSARPGTG